MLAPDFAKKTARLDDDMVGYFYAHLQKCVKSGNLAVVNVTSTGDEVITTAYTYTASASVVCHVGAKLVLVDTLPNRYEINYDAVESAITEKTKAIIPVDLGGVPCDYARLFDIVERKKHLFKPKNKIQEAMGRISVNADTAHAFGAKLHNKMIGTVGDFSSFSFHAVNLFQTKFNSTEKQRKIEEFRTYSQLAFRYKMVLPCL